MNNLRKGLATGLAVGILSVASVSYGLPSVPAYPGGGYGTPVATGQQLYAQGGEVTITYLGWQGASYYEDLFLYSPANGFGYFFPNHSTAAGTTISLGSFSAGTELIFGIYVYDTGNYFYDGPASRNFDNVVHAYMINDYGSPDTTYVGFEDLANGVSDFNYKDEVYTFTGARAASTPESGTTLSLLALGVGAVLAVGRQKQFRST
jgi:hypothetical protein